MSCLRLNYDFRGMQQLLLVDEQGRSKTVLCPLIDQILEFVAKSSLNESVCARLSVLVDYFKVVFLWALAILSHPDGK